MNETNFEYGIETWIILGILTYIFAILIIIYLRYCIIKRTFCPFSKCGLHTICEFNDCRKQFKCRSCDMDLFYGKIFCCRNRHVINSEIPTLNCVCFPPSCSYCHLLCCEVSIDYEFETKLISNPVQNI